MNCHSLHPYVLEGPVLGIHGHLFHQFKCSTELCTINHLAKDSVFAVEMRLLAVGDEKLWKDRVNAQVLAPLAYLRLVRVRCTVRHRYHTTRVKLFVSVNIPLTPILALSMCCLTGHTLSVARISSWNGSPQMDWPPLPVPEGSPVCPYKSERQLRHKRTCIMNPSICKNSQRTLTTYLPYFGAISHRHRSLPHSGRESFRPRAAPLHKTLQSNF